MRIELVYDRVCPNAGQARENLQRALALTGCEARWVEWDRSDAASPAYTREFGSPTCLVEGRDVAGAMASGAIESCRLYPVSGGGFERAPTVEQIARVLRMDCAAPQ
ncbi:MAG: hypothetical protein ACRD1C_11905 [Terriglobales bacterium]